MAMLLGDKTRFAMEVGERDRETRRVDIWAAGQWLTCDDNTVYIPHYWRAVARTADWVRSGRAQPLPFAGLSHQDTHRRLLDKIGNLEDDFTQFRPFNEWAETTDNVLQFAFREGDHLVLTFEFWRDDHLREHPEHAGTVHVARLPAAELTGILDQLVAILRQSAPEAQA